MYLLNDTLRISWAYGHKGLSKNKRLGRSFALRDFHYLKIIKAGHWEYMGHTITKETIDSVDFMNTYGCRWSNTHPVWVIRNKNGMVYRESDGYRGGFSTKDAAKWKLYNDYMMLAEVILDIEKGQ